MTKKKLIGIFSSLVVLSILALYDLLFERPQNSLPLKPQAEPSMEVRIKRVIDGDTVEIEGGERLRYVGIDTPEVGEPFYDEAKKRNRVFLKGKDIRVILCVEDKRDRYGRILGWVYADGIDVGGTLLKEGLARVLIIPPCGLKKAKQYKDYQREAKDGQRGIWKPQTNDY